jgi:hypothetical protein
MWKGYRNPSHAHMRHCSIGFLITHKRHNVVLITPLASFCATLHDYAHQIFILSFFFHVRLYKGL